MMVSGKMTQRNLYIDFLKGIAMIMVILVHSTQAIPGMNSIFNVFVYGQLGCQIFFLASGYLLMKSYNSGTSVFTFYKKRIAAILPGYYLVILLTYIMNGMAYRIIDVGIGFAGNRKPLSILCNLLFLHGLLPFCNNNVVAGGWYIGTTVLIYLLFPVIYKVMYKYDNMLRFIPLCCAVFSWVIAFCLDRIGFSHIYDNNGFFYFNVIVQLPCFLCGCRLYVEHKKGERYGNWSILLGIVLIILTLVCYNMAFYRDMEFLFILMPALFTFGVYYISRKAILENREFRGNRFTEIVVRFGMNSYYIYLSHPFFVWFMPILLLKILGKLELKVNSNILYLLLLPFMFLFSYILSNVFKRICKPFCYKLGK